MTGTVSQYIKASAVTGFRLRKPENPAKIVTRLDFPQRQHRTCRRTSLRIGSSERNPFAFDGVADFGSQQGACHAHDPEQHDRVVSLAFQDHLSAVMSLTDRRFQDFHREVAAWNASRASVMCSSWASSVP